MRLTERGLFFLIIGIIAVAAGLTFLILSQLPTPKAQIYTPQQLCRHNGGTWQVTSNTCKLANLGLVRR